MTRHFHLMFVLALACLGGCDVQGLSGPGRTTTLGYDLSLLQPRAVKDVPAAPFHVAVAQAGASMPDPLVLKCFEAEPSLFRKVSGLPAAITVRDFGNEVPQQHPERLLALAEQMGADMLVLIGGQVEADSTRTPASVADATVIGHYVLPTARVEASGRAIAAVMAVRERRLLFTEMAEAEQSRLSPSVSRHRQTDKAADAVRAKLLATLAHQVTQSLADQTGVSLKQKPASDKKEKLVPSARDEKPAATVYILSDGFHVSLALPVRTSAPQGEWMEIGLGERDWALERGMKWLRGLTAVTTQKEGIAVVEFLNGKELVDRADDKKRVWRVDLSADDWGKLVGALEDEMRMQEVLRDYGAAAKVVKTRDGYSLFHTCHHFALNPLGRTGRELGGGFPKPTPLLEKRIDAALKK